MNRKIKWEQTPPDFSDYAPDRLKSHKLGPLQPALQPAEVEQQPNTPTCAPKKTKTDVPKASTSISPKVQNAQNGAEGRVLLKCIF